jgi:hypothetical protein
VHGSGDRNAGFGARPWSARRATLERDLPSHALRDGGSRGALPHAHATFAVPGTETASPRGERRTRLPPEHAVRAPDDHVVTCPRAPPLPPHNPRAHAQKCFQAFGRSELTCRATPRVRIHAGESRQPRGRAAWTRTASSERRQPFGTRQPAHTSASLAVTRSHFQSLATRKNSFITSSEPLSRRAWRQDRAAAPATPIAEPL